MTLSGVNGSLLIGSVPCSVMYFSSKRRSNMHPETEDTHGCSGTSPLTTENKRIQHIRKYIRDRNKILT